MSATPVKLTVPGSSLTMQVEKAAMATVGKFPEMIFTGTNTDTGEYISLALPKSSADRQLGRLSLDMASAAGALLVFSRDPNPSDPAKAYWGVNWGEASNLPAKGPIVAPRASQTAKTPPRDDTPHPADMQEEPEGAKSEPPANRLEGIFALHRKCWNHAITLSNPQGHGPLSDEALSALTAQVFIRATNLGL